MGVHDDPPIRGSPFNRDFDSFGLAPTSTDFWGEVTTDLPPSETGIVPTFDDMLATTLRPKGGDPYRYDTGAKSFEVPFFITVCIFGVIGNLIVMDVYRQKQYRQSNAALYILNLAVGDLFLLLAVVAFHVTEYYPKSWPILWRSDTQCILHRFGRFTGLNITIFTMVAIAVDRFYAVVHAMEYRHKCPSGRTKRIIFFMWVASAIAAIPSVINFATKYGTVFAGENFVGKTPFACRVFFIGPFYGSFKIIYISVVLFYIPAAITMVLYVVIFVHVWRHDRQFQGDTSNQLVNHESRRSHWKIARVLLVVFLVFAVTYGLLTTYTLVQLFSPGIVPAWVKNVGILLPYANSCMNPVVYSLVNPRFRQSLWVLVASKVSRDPRRDMVRRPNTKARDASSSDGKRSFCDNNGMGGSKGGSTQQTSETVLQPVEGTLPVWASPGSAGKEQRDGEDKQKEQRAGNSGCENGGGSQDDGEGNSITFSTSPTREMAAIDLARPAQDSTCGADGDQIDGELDASHRSQDRRGFEENDDPTAVESVAEVSGSVQGSGAGCSRLGQGELREGSNVDTEDKAEIARRRARRMTTIHYAPTIAESSNTNVSGSVVEYECGSQPEADEDQRDSDNEHATPSQDPAKMSNTGIGPGEISSEQNLDSVAGHGGRSDRSQEGGMPGGATEKGNHRKVTFEGELSRDGDVTADTAQDTSDDPEDTEGRGGKNSRAENGMYADTKNKQGGVSATGSLETVVQIVRKVVSNAVATHRGNHCKRDIESVGESAIPPGEERTRDTHGGERELLTDGEVEHIPQLRVVQKISGQLDDVPASGEFTDVADCHRDKITDPVGGVVCCDGLDNLGYVGELDDKYV